MVAGPAVKVAPPAYANQARAGNQGSDVHSRCLRPPGQHLELDTS